LVELEEGIVTSASKVDVKAIKKRGVKTFDFAKGGSCVIADADIECSAPIPSLGTGLIYDQLAYVVHDAGTNLNVEFCFSRIFTGIDPVTAVVSGGALHDNSMPVVFVCRSPGYPQALTRLDRTRNGDAVPLNRFELHLGIDMEYDQAFVVCEFDLPVGIRDTRNFRSASQAEDHSTENETGETAPLKNQKRISDLIRHGFSLALFPYHAGVGRFKFGAPFVHRHARLK
jgi:hypothetical protein